MALTTYDFYKNTYYGNAIEEAIFSKWEDKASDKLKAYCGENLTDEAIEEYDTKIQKAVCCLADMMYKLDECIAHATDAEKGNIKSMSSGGQSISFGNNDTVFTAVMADKRAQDRLMLDSIEDYLADTGLLYMGY